MTLELLQPINTGDLDGIYPETKIVQINIDLNNNINTITTVFQLGKTTSGVWIPSSTVGATTVKIQNHEFKNNNEIENHQDFSLLVQTVCNTDNIYKNIARILYSWLATKANLAESNCSACWTSKQLGKFKGIEI